MLVNDRRRLDLLLQARSEMRSHCLDAPSVSFYQAKLAELWKRARRSPAYQHLDTYSSNAFNALPSTTRTDLKRKPWDFVATTLDSNAKYYETTGTSGLVTPTPRMAEDVIWNVVSVAEAWRDLLLAGDRALIMMPSDIVPVADLITNVCEYRGLPHTRAYPFSMGITDWDRLVGVWQNLRPTVVFLAPGVALQFTRLLKERGLLDQLQDSVRSLMLLGEVSTAALRTRLGRWWGANVYDASYGSTETGTLAVACQADHLHLLWAAHYFELAIGDDIVPLPESGAGRLVVSPLNLHARPLLRLDTEDLVTVHKGCSCGSNAPVVTVQGRSSDAVSLRGTQLTPREVEDVVYAVDGTTGYLVELASDGSYGRLLLERDVNADRAVEPALCAAVQQASQASLGVCWDDVLFVNTLPSSTKSGGSQKSWKRSNIRVLEPAP